MKERPILFSAPMVRAILAGTKTQTRRVAKIDDIAYGKPVRWVSVAPATTGLQDATCPYGVPGDRLWVRETWREWSDAAWHYAADGLVLPKQRDRDLAAFLAQRAPFTWESYIWKASIHMPRAASRITLEVTDVRVERLQDISVADCIAEGIPRGGPENPDGIERKEYGALWESINGPGSWGANPWVWCVSFRRIDAATQDQLAA